VGGCNPHFTDTEVDLMTLDAKDFANSTGAVELYDALALLGLDQVCISIAATDFFSPEQLDHNCLYLPSPLSKVDKSWREHFRFPMKSLLFNVQYFFDCYDETSKTLFQTNRYFFHRSSSPGSNGNYFKKEMDLRSSYGPSLGQYPENEVLTTPALFDVLSRSMEPFKGFEETPSEIFAVMFALGEEAEEDRGNFGIHLVTPYLNHGFDLEHIMLFAETQPDLKEAKELREVPLAWAAKLLHQP
jgi:hypothetical protein